MRGSHQYAQCPQGRAPGSKWGDPRGAVYPRISPDCEREVEVCGLGMRSVSMCKYQGDICLDGHVCARRRSVDRDLPVNEV